MSHDIFQLISQAQQIGCNLEKANISAEGGLHIHPAYLAKILCLTVAESVEENQNLNNLLNDIHTETTPNERKFLLSFFNIKMVNNKLVYGIIIVLFITLLIFLVFQNQKSRYSCTEDGCKLTPFGNFQSLSNCKDFCEKGNDPKK